jgi:extradiol dioxygenase family protein
MIEDAWQALLKRLAVNGIPVEEGPIQRWGAHGTGTSIYFSDPENNLIEAKFYED